MQTVISYLDDQPLKSALAPLSLPGREAVMLYGAKGAQVKPRLERFFAARGQKVTFLPVEEETVAACRAALQRVLAEGENCALAIGDAGGPMAAAMGAEAARQNLPLIALRGTSGILATEAGDPLPDYALPRLTVDEVIALHGGLVKAAENRASAWSDDLSQDAEAAWNICRIDCAAWNAMSRILAMSRIEDDLSALLDMRRAWSAGGYSRKILLKLRNAGLIADIRESDNTLHFRFKNQRARRLLTTAGNALELQGYSAAMACGFFSDVMSGVQIDWDGVISGGRETSNEIDVLMTHGAAALFISCKNGQVKKEDLYELEAVASRFGGRQAKKMLLATGIPGSPAAREHLLLRAKDMDIALVEDTHLLTRDRLAEKMTALYQ